MIDFLLFQKYLNVGCWMLDSACIHTFFDFYLVLSEIMPIFAVVNDFVMSTTLISKAIADYFKTQPVVKAWIFGSFARGEDTPLSDVDLLVQYEDDGISLLKHAAMICELEKILDRPVDIVEDGTLRPRVRERVNQDRRLIYERER